MKKHTKDLQQTKTKFSIRENARTQLNVKTELTLFKHRKPKGTCVVQSVKDAYCLLTAGEV